MSGKLYTPVRPPGLRSILFRIGVVLGLLSFAVLVVYFEGGLKDSKKVELKNAQIAELKSAQIDELKNARSAKLDDALIAELDDAQIAELKSAQIDELENAQIAELKIAQTVELKDLHPEFPDCVYYVLITITTVGYGDIVPITTRARLMDGILLTPIRFVVIFMFVGTAYQLVFQRLQEGYRMNRVVDKLHNHIIVCGYGATGKATVKELLLQGTDANQIVVLDNSDQALLETTQLDVPVIQGNASSEAVLRSVAIERAAHVIVCPGRDDAAVLISLTAHALNPAAQIIAACRAEENVKLLQRAGAHNIISAASAGGNLMAAATRHVHLVNTMREILTVGGELMIDEREVEPDEVGLKPNELKNVAVLRVYRDQRHFDVTDMPELAIGDKIVYVGKSNHSDPQVSPS